VVRAPLFIVWPWTHEAFGLPLWPLLIAGAICFKLASYWVNVAEPEARADLDRGY
jgi:hypothetical protein